MSIQYRETNKPKRDSYEYLNQLGCKNQNCQNNWQCTCNLQNRSNYDIMQYNILVNNNYNTQENYYNFGNKLYPSCSNSNKLNIESKEDYIHMIGNRNKNKQITSGIHKHYS